MSKTKVQPRFDTDEIETTQEEITPKMAAQWLEKLNEHNRPISPSHVQSLANEMRRGHWQLTHQGIAFDSGGMLIDGQHRLSAIVDTRMTILCLVSRGVSRATFDCMDRLRPRGADDVLAMIGVVNYTKAAAVSRHFAIMIAPPSDPLINKRGAISARVIKETYLTHRATIEPFVSVSVKKHKMMPASVIAALAWASIKYPDQALAFVDHVATGTMLGAKHPAFRLREWLSSAGRSHGGGFQLDQVNRTLTALRAFIEGRDIAQLKSSLDPLAFFRVGAKKVQP